MWQWFVPTLNFTMCPTQFCLSTFFYDCEKFHVRFAQIENSPEPIGSKNKLSFPLQDFLWSFFPRPHLPHLIRSKPRKLTSSGDFFSCAWPTFRIQYPRQQLIGQIPAIRFQIKLQRSCLTLVIFCIATKLAIAGK